MSHSHNLERCRELAVQLNELLDGELSGELCAELKGHLANCPECKIVFDTLGQTVQILHQLDAVLLPLPADLEARLLARVAAAVAATSGE